jgi:hypothetical protein
MEMVQAGGAMWVRPSAVTAHLAIMVERPGQARQRHADDEVAGVSTTEEGLPVRQP